MTSCFLERLLRFWGGGSFDFECKEHHSNFVSSRQLYDSSYGQVTIQSENRYKANVTNNNKTKLSLIYSSPLSSP